MASLIRENRNFRRLLTGAGCANLSDGIGALAFPWLATLISTDPRAVAAVAFAIHLPWFIWSLPVGVITDRADRQKQMVRADLARMAIALAVVLLIMARPSAATDTDAIWMIAGLAGLAFAMGTAEVFRDNAAQTALPSIVPKDQLETANGQVWSVEQVMGQFVGPPLAGLLIAIAVPAPFLFEAFSFALAAWAVWTIAFPPRASKADREGFWRELRAGWTWMRDHPAILRLALILGGLNAAHMAGFTILVLFSQEVLGNGAFAHGILLTAGAAGGVVGGLACPKIAARLGAERSLWLALALMPLPFAGLALINSMALAMALLFLETFVAVLWNVVTVSYRQRVIPDALLGRVNSIYRFFGWGMIPLGALAGGWIMALAAPEIGREAAMRLVFALCAGGFTFLLIYGLARLRLPKG